MGIKTKPILILDFGSQYTQLIARRVRELKVYSQVKAFNLGKDEFEALGPAGVILSGGPDTTTGADSPSIPEYLFDADIPLLGICYGMQAMAAQLGGTVHASDKREYGHAQINLEACSGLFSWLNNTQQANNKSHINVWMSHGDKIKKLPPGFKVDGFTDNTPIAAMSHETKPWYGLQFHPEVTHTEGGEHVLKHFVVDICKAQTSWTPEAILRTTIDMIQSRVGADQVILGLSGGVDSSVVAALLHQAIGRQLSAVFVDNGLLREGEKDQVVETFAKHMGPNLIVVDAKDEFLNQLAGVHDPEEKRKVIGRVFIEVFEREAKNVGGVRWLAQGTIYPDVIESAGDAGGQSKVIKSHHNVGGLPENMSLKLVEPLRDLFKDEVRRLGLKLGLAKEMVYRHPFPGPGLGVRVLGELKPAYLDMLRAADHIFITELKAAELYDSVSQAFCVFLPVKSVGVVGDARQYEYVIAVRAVETLDFMTARWAHLPYDFLGRVSNRIINEVVGISRVTYDISSKPPATIEWE